MNVRILTNETSGKNLLVKGIKSIAKKVDENNLKVNEITESVISDETYSLYRFVIFKISTYF